ncbi:hypothetical protein JQ629_25770 [Bradyrhizobium sp. AUGA SZCCT0222]|uniref:hypothetical protein n=1 Tax=Bradyrhizobium sp. AUGA SZCCT0222 TaxID=2807668 RepID=UPI001BAB4603|nr:hypothetical protein [Bradyrhizobium sp. AUGA SZCCT0222]MBR1270888.1 hypothetical protein [Bradyrhizobium sp. AUGA SZCCT0222]
MQRTHIVVALAALTLMLFIGGCHTAAAAELSIPPRIAPKENPKQISIRSGPPNCSRWTDNCVNCTRGAKDEPATCSNIGFACQPKAIRCLGAQ